MQIAYFQAASCQLELASAQQLFSLALRPRYYLVSLKLYLL